MYARTRSSTRSSDIASSRFVKVHRPSTAMRKTAGSRWSITTCESGAANTTSGIAASVVATSRKPVAPRLVLVGVVVAHERLADAEADQDADEHDRGHQQLGDAVLAGHDVPRVDRQQHDGEQLRDDVADLVGRGRLQQALEEALHAGGTVDQMHAV